MLDGRTWDVPSAADRVRQGMTLDDPDEIVDHMPFVNEGKDEDGNPILYFKRGGKRHVVADIVTPGAGAKDRPGDYRQKMDDAELAAAGVTIPPLHWPVCRSTILAV